MKTGQVSIGSGDETKEMSAPYMNNRRLIQLVQVNEPLYAGNHPGYIDSRAKEEIWEKIAYAMGIPASLCKRSWFNLRDSYRRALRKRRDAFNDGLPYRKWRYEDEMEFLAPYISIRDSNDRVDSTFKSTNRTSPTFESQSNASNPNPSQMQTNETDESTGELRIKRRREHIFHPFESTAPRALQMDPIDAFLLGIGATLRNFTPRNQNVAKAKIFNLVSEMEMQQIIEFKGQWPPALGKVETAVKQEHDRDESVEEYNDLDVRFPVVFIDEKDNTKNNAPSAQVAPGDPSNDSSFKTQYNQYSTNQ